MVLLIGKLLDPQLILLQVDNNFDVAQSLKHAIEHWVATIKLQQTAHTAQINALQGSF